jgi:phosphoribosyl 1,2-cyclic phosphate phosphodiesterase
VSAALGTAARNTVELQFLGTDASGGTPGAGRSLRRESSLLVRTDDSLVLLDVSRDFTRQAEQVERIDAVLLTHAHRDACGGVAQLRAWARRRSLSPIDVFASVETIDALRQRYALLDHCRFVTIRERERTRVGRFVISALTVPHALDPRFPTFAWKLDDGATTVVYASDVGYLTSALRGFSRGARVLVIDAALWGRWLFSHLTIDRALPELCRWPVDRIVLTQIGRSVPAHERLEHEAARLCPRALPAYDRMTLELH